MRSIWKVAGVLSMLMLIAVPLAAQGRGPGQGPGMRQAGPAAMLGNPGERILEHRETLGLTDQQVAEIERIQARVAEVNQPRIERLREAIGDADPREMSPEERAAHRERMEELRPVMLEVRETNRAAGREIHDLLTEEQKEKLRPLIRRGMRGGPDGVPGRGKRGPRGQGPGGVGGPGGPGIGA